MNRTSPLIMIVATLLASSSFAAGNPAALRAAADRAMLREQYCDASFLYAKLDEQAPKADIAILAASAAAQGGDRAGAVTMLESFDARFPGDPQSADAARRLQTIKQAVQRAGPGATCRVPAAECGNGLIEGTETCDDGNRAGGDSCPATCIEAAAPVAVAPVPATTTTTPTTTPSTTPAWAAPVTTPSTTTPAPVEPAPVVEPAPATVVEPAPVVVEPVATEPEPTVTQTDIVAPAPAPKGPGAPVAGIILASLGGLVAVGGGTALGVGLVPAIAFLTGGGGQTQAANDYENAADAFERREAAGDAADAYASQTNNAANWNNQGRWLALGGGVGLAAGVGLLVGGIILIANNGADIDDDVDEDEDKNDANDTDDDADEER